MKVSLMAALVVAVPSVAVAQTTQPAPPTGAAATRTENGAEIVVTGSIYRGEVASGGARIDVPTKELPLSISVVTDALIRDRQVRNIRELADNVAGVRSRASGSGAFTIDFTIRGLQGGNGSVVAVNGFRVENFSSGFDPQAVERVEFLKGPASVLYGASGALSGLVNIVTKTPKADNFLVADLTGGDPTYVRATIDGNVRIANDLESRTNVAVTHDRQVNAFRAVNEQFVDQAFRWHPGDISILAEGSYFHAIGPSREATTYPTLSDFFALPKDFKTGERWDRNINTAYMGHLDASWKVTPNLTLRQGVNYQHYREEDHDVAPYTYDTYQSLIGPHLLGRSLRDGVGITRYLVSQTEARWTVALGPTTHKLLAGFEYGHEKTGGPGGNGQPIAPLDLLNPVYGAPEPNDPQATFFQNTIVSKAAYLQDYVEWGQFRLLAGLRRDDTTSSSLFCDLTVPGCPTDPAVNGIAIARETALSPRLGLAWLPTGRTTLFGSWSKSFNPNAQLDRNGNLLPPERGVQYEVGLRQELAEPGRLTLSLSAFQITRRNIADCDPTVLGCARAVAIGEQRVRGGEVELAGKPVEWLDVVAAYTYLDGKVTRSNADTSGIAVGSRLPETVPHSASLFAKAALAPLGFDSVSVSGGIYYLHKRPGRDFFSGSFALTPFSASIDTLPASMRVDLGAYWDVRSDLRLQANITNLFDTKVYEPTNIGFSRSQVRRMTVGARVTL